MLRSLLRATVAASLALAAATAAAAAQQHPVSDVLALLANLDGALRARHDNERQQFVLFAEWCKAADTRLSRAVQGSFEEMHALTLLLSAKNADHGRTEARRSAAVQAVSDGSRRLEEARSQRGAEKSVFERAEPDLTATVDAIRGARDQLKAVLSEHGGVLLSEHQQSLSLSQRAEWEARGRAVARAAHAALQRTTAETAPDHDGYTGGAKSFEKKFKSLGVLDLLWELHERTGRQLEAVRQEETERIASFAALEKSTAQAQAEGQTLVDDLVASGSALGGEISQAEAGLADARSDHAAESEARTQQGSMCEAKSREWAARDDKMRQESVMLGKARDIIGKVSGVQDPTGFEPKVRALLQSATAAVERRRRPARAKAASSQRSNLLARGSAAAGAPLPAEAALARVREVFARHARGSLVAFAAATATGRDVSAMERVLHAVQQLVAQLQKEQSSEDEQKHWCDLEVGKTNDRVARKRLASEKTQAKVDSMQATHDLLAGDVADAAVAISDAQSYVRRETELRASNRAENEAAMQDFEAGVKALEAALVAVRSFYERENALPLALAQAPVAIGAAPETWDSASTGVSQQRAAESLVALLEEVKGEFAESFAEARGAEASEQLAHEADLTAQASLLAAKEAERAHKMSRLALLEQDADSTRAHLRQIKNEIEVAEGYLGHLQQPCVAGNSSYDDRSAARAAELDALRSAQRTIEETFD